MGWPLEQQWLCRLVGANRQASTTEAFVQAAATLDWDALLSTANRHGLTELLQPALVAARPLVPTEVIARVEQRVVAVTALNLSRAAQLIRLMERLTSHGVRALAFKGPTLSQVLYHQLGRRASNDLDILVDRRLAPRVRPLLLADGYTLPPRHRHQGGSLLYGILPSAGRDDTLLPPTPALASVDLHIRFAYWTQGIRMDADALFDRAVVVDLLGARVPTPCTEDLLLVLAVHGMMHGWCGLRLLTDIDALAPQVGDWNAIVERARSANALRVSGWHCCSVTICWGRSFLSTSSRVRGTIAPPGISPVTLRHACSILRRRSQSSGTRGRGSSPFKRTGGEGFAFMPAI